MRKNDLRQMIRPIAQYSVVVKDRVGQNKSEPQKSRRSGDHVRQRLALLISARMGKGSQRSRRRLRDVLLA